MGEISNQINFYRFGTDTVIAGTVQFAAPFEYLATKVLSRSQCTYESFCEDVNFFLSKFPIFVEGYTQIVAERYADTIRRNTLVIEVRGKTTMSLAKQIREESFADIDRALKNYGILASQLGIALANTSTGGSAITGALVGGSLDLLVTDGEDSLIGTFAGAILGGMAANSAKKDIKQAQYSTALESVKTITSLVASTPPRLVDAYVSYMFGGNADFERRDKEIAYALEITSAIINACLNVIGLVASIENSFQPSWITGVKKLNDNSRLLLDQLNSWRGYIQQLQESCTAGIMDEARVS